MIAYLIKMTLCAILFLGIYFLFLEKEDMHCFKRFYLIGSLFLSILIPLISLELTAIPFPVWNEYTSAIEMEISEDYVFDAGAEPIVPIYPSEKSVPFFMKKEYLLCVYILVSIFLLLRYLYNIIRLLRLISKHKTISYKHAKLVLMDGKNITFSFWKYIFIQESQFYNGKIKSEIISHELAHIHQKHTLDVLLLEFLTIVFWFNPIIYLYKRSIKLNHEFLADKQVIKETNHAIDYQLILLNEIEKNNGMKLASYFNYLITKKRFIMMTKRTSLKTVFWKSSLALFVMLAAFCFFSLKVEAQEIAEVNPGNMLIVPESGVTIEEMDTYKAIVNKYLDGVDRTKVAWKSKDVSEEDWKTLYPIFIRMTNEQRKEQLHVYFVGPLNPLRLRSPNKDEWNSAISNKNKKIWLDGKEVTSEELNSYNRQNIAYFIRDYANNNNSYLWTQKGIDEYQRKFKSGISLPVLLEIKPQIWFTRER